MTRPTTFCCEQMELSSKPCPTHGDDCPDVLIRWSTQHGPGLPIHDGGGAISVIRYCPWCAQRVMPVELDDGEYNSPDDFSLLGNGQPRPYTAEAFSLAENAKDWVDERVSKVFGKWCDAMGYHRAYGVHRWRINGKVLYVEHDLSARSCFNSESRELPVELLWMDDDAMAARLVELRAEIDAKEAAKTESERLRQLAHLKAEITRLGG